MVSYSNLELGVAGKYLKEYKPKTNYNSFINGLCPQQKIPLIKESIVLAGNKKYPDVSFYQGKINWDIMRQKTDAVIIRAGQNVWEDPEFDRNYYESKKRGMYRGLYYFYDDRVSPKTQADKLYSIVGEDVPEMEIYCDWERTYGGGYFKLPYVVEFMKRISEYYPGKDAFYSGYYFFRDHSNPITNSAEYNYLKNKPLWMAWYTENPSYVLVPNPWTSLDLWQYGTPALYYGQETIEIDMNIFNNSDNFFYSKYGGSTPPPQTGEGMIIITKVTTGNINGTLNGRTGAGTAFPIVAALKENDILVCDQEQRGAEGSMWRHVRVCIRNGVNSLLPVGGVWASDGGNGMLQTELNSFNAPIERVASVSIGHEISVKYSDGSLDVFRKENIEIPKV